VPERAGVVALMAIAGALIAGAMHGLILPGTVPFIIAAGLMSVTLFLAYRFSSCPEVQQKRKMQAELRRIRAEMAKNEDDMQRLTVDKRRLDQEESSRVKEFAAKQRDCDHREQQEIAKIDHDLQRVLKPLTTQRQALSQAESADIAQVLHTIQQQSRTANLASYDLRHATIPGIGPELKKRLSANGIRTAADIVDVHIVRTGWGRRVHETAYIEVPGGRRVHVEGIGSKKVSALWSWCHNIQIKVRSQATQSSQHAQESAIRAKYRAQRQTLDAQESREKQEGQQKKELIREKYRRERDGLVKQLQSIHDQFARSRLAIDQRGQQKNFSDKQWILERVKWELQAYHQVNLMTYVKRVLFLE
jgi:hypothetical protein